MDNERLFESDNPLSERLGDAFFDELPQSPGIYKMYGATGQLLYVGKAKNLRNRLFTYRRARVGRESRKVIRLVRMIHRISLEELASEEEALLRENELIRNHKPEFNHAKKQPEAYYYLTFRAENSKIQTDLRMHLRKGEASISYGAFKGHVTVRRGLGALLRQLYIIGNEVRQPFQLPSKLLKKLTPMHCSLELPDLKTGDWLFAIENYLEGKSTDLLTSIITHAREKSMLEAFIGKVILKDMEALKFFYERCTRRNYKIVKSLDLDSPLIPKDKLDDYLVKLAFMDEE